jgi:hypothetical protein
MNILKYTLWTVLILTFGNLFLSSYLKNESDVNKMDKSDVFLAIPIILYLLVIACVLFFGVKFLWKFLLNRITEVSKAVKGQKVD